LAKAYSSLGSNTLLLAQTAAKSVTQSQEPS
jgi:hypothetical protein